MNDKDKKPGSPWTRNLLIWVGILFALVLFVQMIDGGSRSSTGEAMAYSEFVRQVDEGNVRAVTMATSSTGNSAISGKLESGEVFHTVAPAGSNVADKMISKGVGVQVKAEEQGSIWLYMLYNSLPFLLMIGVAIFVMRQMQKNAGSGAMGFGKSRARMLTEKQGRVTFADVAGIDEAREELQEIVEYLKDPGKFARLGGKIPKGALLVGPPGTGKTLLARAIAGEAGVPFFTISGSDFVEMFVGVGASRVRDMFDQAKKSAPCIVFIDEIDAVGRHRGAGLGNGNDEREQTLNQLLVEMDGFESNEGVILMAATNRPDVLDPALLRPGRFDRRVVVSRPDVRGREEILRVHTRKIPLSDDVDLSVLARGTPGFSGADLANMVNEAALAAARQNRKAVLMFDFEIGRAQVLMGVERKSLLLSDEEKKVTAYHEAGHALVAVKLPHSDPLHKVTIIPRGMALGVTMQLPIDDKHNYTKDYLETTIAIMMGGRIAEEMFLNQMSTGAGNDIERATELARKMVCEFGMSDLGPLTFGKKEEQIFLGREIAQHRDYSEATAIKIDDEVRRLVQKGYDSAKNILAENNDVLIRIAAALREREVLDANEIRMIIEGKELPRSTPPSKPDDGVQQVLKPEPGRPGLAKGGEHPAPA